MDHPQNRSRETAPTRSWRRMSCGRRFVSPLDMLWKNSALSKRPRARDRLQIRLEESFTGVREDGLEIAEEDFMLAPLDERATNLVGAV